MPENEQTPEKGKRSRRSDSSDTGDSSKKMKSDQPNNAGEFFQILVKIQIRVKQHLL